MLFQKGLSINDVTHSGGGGSSKSLVYYSKMRDKGGWRGQKSQKMDDFIYGLDGPKDVFALHFVTESINNGVGTLWRTLLHTVHTPDVFYSHRY